MEWQISLNSDEDGFLSHECPQCERLFKTQPGKGADGPIGHCPYCEHDGEECWLTQEQASYIESVTMPDVRRMFDKVLSDAARGSNFITFTPSHADSGTDAPPSPPVESNQIMPIHVFSSGDKVKHDGQNLTLRCPVTGATENVVVVKTVAQAEKFIKRRR